MKKRIAFLLAAVMLFSVLAGCTVTTSSSSSSTSTTVEKSEGNVPDKAATQIGAKVGDDAAVKSASGKAAQGKENPATLVIVNDTGDDFKEIYFSSASSDKWGDEWLGDSAPLEDGYTITMKGRFKYAADDTVWDLLVVEADGSTLQFENLNLANAKDPKEINIILFHEGDGNTYSVVVQ